MWGYTDILTCSHDETISCVDAVQFSCFRTKARDAASGEATGGDAATVAATQIGPPLAQVDAQVWRQNVAGG